MKELGFNYRLTDFQAALGISQLKKLDNFLVSRRDQASIYDRHLSQYEYLTTPKVRENCTHSYHLYPLKIDFKKLKVNKVNFFRKMKAKNINLQVHYMPVHIQPYYKKKYGFFSGQFPISEEFYSQQVSIPIYPSLKKSEIKYIIDCLLSSLNLKK
jgi:dTDP-4-amino-4,6-dideoxygalactose transaminase